MRDFAASPYHRKKVAANKVKVQRKPINLKKYLRADGRVAIIDRDPDQGAPSHFWTRDRITSLASRAGYDTVRVVDEIDRHLIIVLRPRPGTSVAER